MDADEHSTKKMADWSYHRAVGRRDLPLFFIYTLKFSFDFSRCIRHFTKKIVYGRELFQGVSYGRKETAG